jgi:uncharacterized protein
MTAAVARETTDAADEPAVARETPPAPSPAARVLLLPLRAYRRLISPLLRPRCRYYPSCSSYAEQALRELGAVRGLIVAGWRLLRCNPFSPGGLDPLEERSLFSSAPDPSGSREART